MQNSHTSYSETGNYPSDIVSLFQCGQCESQILDITPAGKQKNYNCTTLLKCRNCGSTYSTRDGIYNFQTGQRCDADQRPDWNPEEFANLIPDQCSIYYSHAEWLQKRLGYYHRVAELVSRYESRFTKNLLLDAIPTKSSMTILDIGCGAGYLSFALAERHKSSNLKILCLDCLPEHVNLVNRRRVEESAKGIVPILGTASSLHIKDRCIDAIICSEVMEHVPDPTACASEMYRVLKNGGILALSTPNQKPYERYNCVRLKIRKLFGCPPGPREDFFDNPLEYTEVATCLEKAGFEIMDIILGLKVPCSKRFFMYLPTFMANTIVNTLEYLLPADTFAVSVMIRAQKR